MANGIIYDATWDTTTKTLGFYDKAGNLIYSCVVDTQPQPIVDDATKPLYFLSKQDGSTVSLRVPTGDSFEKSTDGTTWETMAGGAAGKVTLDTGDGIYIRAAAERTNYPTSESTSFRFGITGSVEAYHNINSVLTPNFANLTDLTTLTVGSGANCLKRIFKQCAGLTKAPLLPATVLSQGCYEGAFRDCTGLLQLPNFPFTTTAINACSDMFYGCTALTDCSSIDLLADYVDGDTSHNYNGAFYEMFRNCTSLTKAPHIKATRLGANALNGMFYGCSSLNEIHIDVTDISATNCLQSWVNSVSATGNFYGVEGVAYPLDSASGIPQGWTVHQSAFVESANLPLCFKATQNASSVTLKVNGTITDTYEYSTDGLTWTTWTADTAVSLDDGDKIFVRTAADRTTAQTTNDYINFLMSGQIEAYNNVNSLLQKTAFPSLTDLTSLANGAGGFAFIRLFKDCTALTKSPLLPAITLSEACYRAMHSGCTALAQASDLPATTMATQSCASMYNDCTALVKAPEILATTLATQCLYTMFQGCTSLNEIHIHSTDISATDCLTNWVNNVSATGNFHCIEGVPYTTGTSGCPSGWTKHTTFVESPNLPLCFKATQDSSSVTLTQRNGITEVYEYSVDGLAWTTWSFDTQIPLNNGDKIFVRTQSTSRSQQQNNLTYICFRMTGQIEAYNNVNSLLKKTAFASITDLSQVANSEYAFTELFYNQWMSDSYTNNALVKAPLFPATTLSAFCYAETFRKCNALVQGPELPATNLANYCYYNLYYNAASLNEVHISATNVSTTGCIRDWLTGVSATGDFYCVNGVTYPTGTSGIPSGWTRHDLT